jgi:hypothetical protein
VDNTLGDEETGAGDDACGTDDPAEAGAVTERTGAADTVGTWTGTVGTVGT